MKHICLTILSLLALVAASAQQSSAEIWNRANTAYINGNYEGAVELYEQILEGGEFSSTLYYNLGNGYFKQNILGKALLNYYKAQALDPTDTDILHNIGVAEGMTKDRVEELPRFVLSDWSAMVRGKLSCRGWSVLSLLMLALMLGALMLYLLASRMMLRKGGFYISLLSLLLFVISTSYALRSRDEMLDRHYGVVMSRSLPVKSSPSVAATDLFILHEGTRVRLKSEVEGWREVLLSDGKKGWVVESNISEI
ncbi:MAG: competence protein [Rikenellaceae bacterium]